MKPSLYPHLADLRNAMLALHKTLLDAERVNYEKVNGPIRSPNHFLQLLTGDPWFAWLRPLSLHIVIIDEAMESKEPLTAAAVAALVDEAALLLTAVENGDGSSGRYFEALQRDPNVVLAHAKVAKLLSDRPRPEA